MSTAKEQLAARVASMTEDEAREALSRLDGDELTDEQRGGIIEAMDAMDRGEGVDGADVFRRAQAMLDSPRRRPAG
jgi:hypothetical protein